MYIPVLSALSSHGLWWGCGCALPGGWELGANQFDPWGLQHSGLGPRLLPGVQSPHSLNSASALDSWSFCVVRGAECNSRETQYWGQEADQQDQGVSGASEKRMWREGQEEPL